MELLNYILHELHSYEHNGEQKNNLENTSYINFKVEAPKTEQTTAMTNETRILLFDVEIVVAPHVVLKKLEECIVNLT